MRRSVIPRELFIAVVSAAAAVAVTIALGKRRPIPPEPPFPPEPVLGTPTDQDLLRYGWPHYRGRLPVALALIVVVVAVGMFAVAELAEPGPDEFLEPGLRYSDSYPMGVLEYEHSEPCIADGCAPENR